ncbi:hypothetical protein [Kordiimonas gwangyangensis]|jgi:hypothetical protein|uniref:hypothetical protein n=1 Tax=Kordiimonas gwangyangensis TaxID=288022 RepID=UPI00038029DB|nr:hypothetical protein [Kordiimonas gwangyangensis]
MQPYRYKKAKAIAIARSRAQDAFLARLGLIGGSALFLSLLLLFAAGRLTGP